MHGSGLLMDWWHNLQPGQDVLQGAVLVTGVTDEDMDSLPVPDAVVEMFETVARISAEHGVVPPKGEDA